VCATPSRPRLRKGEQITREYFPAPLMRDDRSREILERAFDAALEAIKGSGQHFDAESDEELEAALRRELIEIARNGVSDPETLRDILLDSMP
jgi:hypothetical protein